SNSAVRSFGSARRSSRLSTKGVSPPCSAVCRQQKNNRAGQRAEYESSLCSEMKYSAGYSVDVYTPSLIAVRGELPSTYLIEFNPSSETICWKAPTSAISRPLNNTAP